MSTIQRKVARYTSVHFGTLRYNLLVWFLLSTAGTLGTVLCVLCTVSLKNTTLCLLRYTSVHQSTDGTDGTGELQVPLQVEVKV